MVAAAASDSLAQRSWLIQGSWVSTLVEGQDDLKPPAVNLASTVFGKVRELGAVVPDQVAGSGAQGVQVVRKRPQTLGVPSGRRVGLWRMKRSRPNISSGSQISAVLAIPQDDR